MSKNKSRFHFEQGLNFFHKESYSQASTYFEEAILENPDYSEALYNLSCCYSMTGEKDKAIMYLSRAAKLNPHCIDWASEDREFNALHEDPVFNKIIAGETPDEVIAESPEKAEDAQDDEFKESQFEQVEAKPPEAKEEENPVAPSGDPPPNLEDENTAKSEPVKSEFPPCICCEGLIEKERRPLFNPQLSLGVIFGGVAISCGLVFSFYAIIGIPAVAVGLFLFSQFEETWVCQNCGARGAECGQLKKEQSKDS
jgi:tetratricopeptide (TPR) repeat protein